MPTLRASVVALCSVLVINNWGWPRGRINLKEPPGSVTSVTMLLSLGRVA